MKIAAIQMISTPVLSENLATARRLMQQAADEGAKMLLLPEYWPLMGMQETDKVDIAEPADAEGVKTLVEKLQEN